MRKQKKINSQWGSLSVWSLHVLPMCGFPPGTLQFLPHPKDANVTGTSTLAQSE